MCLRPQPAVPRVEPHPGLLPSLLAIFRTLFKVPYPATPLFATLTKTAGVGIHSSHFGNSRSPIHDRYRYEKPITTSPLVATHPKNPPITEHPTRMRVLSERNELRLHPGWFCGTNDLSFGLSPLFTTLVENCLVTPFLATLPKSLDLKSFICHTCDTPPGAAGVLLTRHATRHVYPERPSKVKGLSCSPTKDFYPERSPLLPRTPFNESTPAEGWHDVSCPYWARAKEPV